MIEIPGFPPPGARPPMGGPGEWEEGVIIINLLISVLNYFCHSRKIASLSKKMAINLPLLY